MKSNLGIFDRILRVSIAIAVLVLYFMGVLSGTLTLVLLLVAAIFIITGFIGFCPLYWSIGISSKAK